MSDFPPPGPPPVPPPEPPRPADAPAPGWWQASDGNWYPPEEQPGYAVPGYPMPPAPGQPSAFGPPPGYGPPPSYGQPPGYGPPPSYGQPSGYGYGYGMSVAKPTNGAAIAALVCGCAQFIVWILATIPAIICGHVALSQIKRTGQEGRGMAIAGLVLGYVGLIFFVLFILLVVVAGTSVDTETQFESLVSPVIGRNR